MNDEEIRTTIEEVKAQVKAKPENKDKSDDEIDEMILDSFYEEFSAGKLEKDDLEALANAMGYEFTDEFAADEGPDAEEAGEDVSKEDAEELKVIEPGESKEEFKEKIEEAKDGGEIEDVAEEEKVEEDKEDIDEDEEEDDGFASDDDEEDQREKASKLFKMNL